jgi:acyl-coenzyme A thioesterase PaaI-like protein
MSFVSLKKAQRELFLFGLFKIRLLLFCSPKLIRIDENEVLLRIPLNWRTRNHLGAMYFGVLAVGADIAGGFHAFSLARNKGLKISLLFKSFHAQFLKRAESDVFFHSSSGKVVAQMLETSKQSGERVNQTIPIRAFVLQNGEEETVADFELEVSVKVIDIKK